MIARTPASAAWTVAAVLLAIALAAAWARDLGVVSLWRDLLTWRIGGDSWAVLQRALDALPPHGEDLYQTVYFDRGIKFVYPPTALLLNDLAGLVCLGCAPAARASVLTAGGLLLTLAVPLSMFDLMRRASPQGRLGHAHVGAATGVVALCFCFYPLLLANVLGQTQAWLNGLFAIACWAFVRGRLGGAGALIGLMTLVKPHAALLLLWAAARGHRRMAVGGLAVVVAGGAVAAVMYGIESHVGYLRMASYIADRGESMYANQSITGFLARLLLPEGSLGWSATTHPPFHPLVALGSRLSIAAGVAFALLAGRSSAEAGRWPDFAIAAVAMLVASPIAWEHHFAILLPLYALAFTHWSRRDDLWPLRLAMASALLTGTFLGPLARLDARPWTVLQSYQLAGAFLMLSALMLALHRAVAVKERAA